MNNESVHRCLVDEIALIDGVGNERIFGTILADDEPWYFWRKVLPLKLGGTELSGISVETFAARLGLAAPC